MAGEGHQKLTIEAQAKGTDKTAADIDKIADAQEGLKGKTEGQAKQAAAAAESQKKLGASQSDYVEILRQISPMLGNLVDSMMKGSKIAGDLATQNINLTGTFQKVTEAIKGNVGSLQLLLAGGAVVIGILAIVKAVQKMREEFERATKAVNDQIEAMTELRRQEKDRQQVIEEIAATRREGGFTAEEARQVGQRVERIRQRSPFLQEGAVAQAAGILGPGRDDEELSRIAMLMQTGRLQLDPGARPETRERQVERGLERHAEVIDREFARERQQHTELLKEALAQMQTQLGGSLDALAKIIEQYTAGEGVDATLLARALQQLPEAEKTRLGDLGTVDFVRAALQEVGVKKEAAEEFDERYLAIARRMYLLVESQDGKANTPAPVPTEPVEPQTVNIHNDYRNAKFVGPDAASRARAIRNGETLARQRSER